VVEKGRGRRFIGQGGHSSGRGKVSTQPSTDMDIGQWVRGVCD
jgi:hypothetical protein